MKIIKVTQGTPEWSALRARYNTASEAPAMMGLSKYQSRDELLRQKATGIVPEVTSHQQSIFDRGHTAEAAARTVLEENTGEEFYPITAVSDDDALLASMDGITLDDCTLFEHKLWNDKLAAQVRAGQLEPHYYWQLEQQLLVSGAKRVIFVCSDGTRDNWVQMEYRPVAGRAGQLLFSWEQFDADRSLYIPPAVTPQPVGRTPETLPALRIEVTGMVTGSNLDAFKAHALAVFGGINRELSTDAQFADAEQTVKWCADVEDRLAAAKQHALSQTASIDELFRTIDDISAEARRVRLELDKLVKARKEAVRGELLAEGIAALRSHVTALNTRLGKPFMPVIAADFAGAIKGKRTVDSLRDAVNTELARAKIEASAVADRIQANVATLRELATAHAFLFSDTPQIILKAPDDLTALVKLRIAEHQAAQAANEEATRQTIRVEEQAKAEREARELVAREAAEVMRLASVAAREAKETQDLANAFEFIAPVAIELVAPFVNVVPMIRPAVAALEAAPTLKLGQIAERLRFSLPAEFLRTLGFEPAGREKGAVLFHESSFPLICAALVAHVEAVQAKAAA